MFRVFIVTDFFLGVSNIVLALYDRLSYSIFISTLFGSLLLMGYSIFYMPFSPHKKFTTYGIIVALWTFVTLWLSSI